MLLYVVPFSMNKKNSFIHKQLGKEHSINYESEIMFDNLRLEAIFNDYKVNAFIFKNLDQANSYVDKYKSNYSYYMPPIYEVKLNASWPSDMIYDPEPGMGGPMPSPKHSLLTKYYLSDVIIKNQYPCNIDKLELKDISRLEECLETFDLKDEQNKAALELIECLKNLQGEDREHIRLVVNMSIRYLKRESGITKEEYEILARQCLTERSESLQILGKSMMAFAMVFAVIATALMVTTSSLSIPAITIIPTIGLLGIGFFAAGGKHQAKLSSAINSVGNAFQ